MTRNLRVFFQSFVLRICSFLLRCNLQQNFYDLKYCILTKKKEKRIKLLKCYTYIEFKSKENERFLTV